MCRIPFKFPRSNELEVSLLPLGDRPNKSQIPFVNRPSEKEPKGSFSRAGKANGNVMSNMCICAERWVGAPRTCRIFSQDFWIIVAWFHSIAAQRMRASPCLEGKWVIASIFPLLFCLFVLPLIYNASSLCLPLFSSVCRANLHVQFGFSPFPILFYCSFSPIVISGLVPLIGLDGRFCDFEFDTRAVFMFWRVNWTQERARG